MDRADTRTAGARSAAARRSDHLLDRHVREPGRPARSQDRRDARVQAAAGHDPAQHPQRPRRQHLVHRQRQRHGRPARSAHRRHQGLSDAGSRGARSPHADLRSRRQPVVHAAELEHGRPPRAVDRRDQAAHGADRQRAAVRHHRQLAGHVVGGLQRRRQAREHRPEDHGAEGISDAVAGDARPPARRAEGRHDLLRRLARLSGPLRSEDRRVQGVAVAERRRAPSPTRWSSSTTSSGTTSRGSGPTRSSGSIRRPRSSRAGRFRQASASSATCARRPTATS